MGEVSDNEQNPYFSVVAENIPIKFQDNRQNFEYGNFGGNPLLLWMRRDGREFRETEKDIPKVSWH